MTTMNVMNDDNFTLRQQIRYGTSVLMVNGPEECDNVLLTVGAAAINKEDARLILLMLGFLPQIERNSRTNTVTFNEGNPAINRYKEKRGIK